LYLHGLSKVTLSLKLPTKKERKTRYKMFMTNENNQGRHDYEGKKEDKTRN